MSLKERITDDVKSAMKAGDKDRLKVLRLMTAEMKQVEVDERRDLDDNAVLLILEKMVKQRRDSIAQYTRGARQDLADAEAAEIDVIKEFLPAPLSDAELDILIEDAIRATGAAEIRDMGKVMGAIRGWAQGRVDMALVGARVKRRLS